MHLSPYFSIFESLPEKEIESLQQEMREKDEEHKKREREEEVRAKEMEKKLCAKDKEVQEYAKKYKNIQKIQKELENKLSM